MKAAFVVLALALGAANAFVPHPAAPRRAPTVRSATVAEPEKATAFDLKEYLETKRVSVEKALDDSLQVTCPEVKTITESMKYSLNAGGKRVRPIMCIAACEMFGGTEEMAMPTAVALEMIHTMSLVHDDLPAMDDDDLRRGVPTNHVVYGEDIAILAGDALLSTAFEHCAAHTKGVPAERLVEVLRRLGESVGAVGLAGGQVMDLQCEGKEGVTLQELQWIHAHKTAALLKVAVTAGAILAGASEEEIKACETYALDVGLAFQVADDILDVTASTEELGKTAGKDEAVDKTTYVKLIGLEESKIEARRLVEDAVKALSPFGEKAAPLIGIADYIVARKN
eukprot:CAMPEP_0182571674 /NCGR_PEP_ID=MMETSP1324-20130603/14277_1 /TAXON_ID=236786 /ORGANISM="Florenciella sp., Strain RCC1587" /LENGTH=339 /DNA_ID=CAMNT_0024786353 /DNA_START=46 /DNA_END=1065 /DNA_ORIENTATION=+